MNWFPTFEQEPYAFYEDKSLTYEQKVSTETALVEDYAEALISKMKKLLRNSGIRGSRHR